MGITSGAIKLAGLALKDQVQGGCAITFGVQGVNATYDQACQLLGQVGKETKSLDRDLIRDDDLTQFGKTVHQDTLFRLMGFDGVESIDFFPDEKPTHILDLNRPVPSSMHEKYDLVYDGGTSEHCFCSSESLCNAIRLVKVGGKVIHHLPMNNWVDHGFFQFSPTIFFDLYEANGFTDLKLALHFVSRRQEKYIYYDPRVDGRLPYVLGGAAKVLVHFSATKVKPASEIVLPIQGRYRSTFGGEVDRALKESKRSPLDRLKQSLRKRSLKLRATPL